MVKINNHILSLKKIINILNEIKFLEKKKKIVQEKIKKLRKELKRK